MTLRDVEGPPGAPWERETWGRIERYVVESEVLAGNPLGDPSRRPLYVYLPEGYRDDSEARFASIYVIQGMTGQLDMWANRTAFEPTMFERVDGLFSRGDLAPTVVVFVDAWTSVGGSQFINSAATGRYLDYLCDEVVPWVDERFATVASRDHRGITGKSSGGYGAMVVPMLRPDTFGALASHAGDALFECCYLPEFPTTVRTLRDHFDGSYERFFEELRSSSHFDFGLFGAPLNSYAMAAAYSPDEGDPPNVVLPFDVETGRLLDDVWQRWLGWDPVRMVGKHGDALSSMKLIYLDAGKSDEYYLDLGAQAVARELDLLGLDYELDLFAGKHGGIQYRYPSAIGKLARVLAP